MEMNISNRNEKLLEQIELINMKIQGLKDRRQLCNTHIQLYSLPREQALSIAFKRWLTIALKLNQLHVQKKSRPTKIAVHGRRVMNKMIQRGLTHQMHVNYRLYKFRENMDLKDLYGLRNHFFRIMVDHLTTLNNQKDAKILTKSGKIIYNLKQYHDQVYRAFIKDMRNSK